MQHIFVVNAIKELSEVRQLSVAVQLSYSGMMLNRNCLVQ